MWTESIIFVRTVSGESGEAVTGLCDFLFDGSLETLQIHVSTIGRLSPILEARHSDNSIRAGGGGSRSGRWARQIGGNITEREEGKSDGLEWMTVGQLSVG